MNDAGMQTKVTQIMDRLNNWVKGVAQLAQGVNDVAGWTALEKTIRQQGQEQLALVLQDVTQGRVEEIQQEARVCPTAGCGSSRRHKGTRAQKVLTSLGSVTVEDVYFVCPRCDSSGRGAARLIDASVSAPMHGLMCLLGASLSSFEKAQTAATQLLGVKVDGETIRQHCLGEGRRLLRDEPPPPRLKAGDDLTGSCDGTMVNTREKGWRELKAFRFEHTGGVYLGAALECAERFGHRLARAAVRVGAAGAREFWWVSDAADWIDRAAALRLPRARRIVDLWHANQHVHEAARAVHGEGSSQGKAWAERWCERLREQGARAVWPQLQKLEYQGATRQAAVGKLARFLKKQENRMDYPEYEAKDWPISSGGMESGCKQLGLRLKGAGMRWRQGNVTPMAQLVALWSTARWPPHLTAV